MWNPTSSLVVKTLKTNPSKTRAKNAFKGSVWSLILFPTSCQLHFVPSPSSPQKQIYWLLMFSAPTCHRPLQVKGYLDSFTVGTLIETVSRCNFFFFFFSRSYRNMSICVQATAQRPLTRLKLASKQSSVVKFDENGANWNTLHQVWDPPQQPAAF